MTRFLAFAEARGWPATTTLALMGAFIAKETDHADDLMTYAEDFAWMYDGREQVDAAGDNVALLVVDVSGASLRVYVDGPATRAAIATWEALDRRRVGGGGVPDGWLPFDEFMEAQGFIGFRTACRTLG